MPTSYSHTNIVARDPDRLARFYTEVFDCPRVAERNWTGDWLGRGMGRPGTALQVIHVRLPVASGTGPTIEIFRMPDLQPGERPTQDRPGLMHIAFFVDDIRYTLEQLLARGGAALGEISSVDIPGGDSVEFVYARDPEGNIVELQEIK
jgi:catechol 2,3-dioxygenase-like lactoylglutathione lyase family enzyme